MIVTNDWFTGLLPAFIKSGKFGDVFNNTRLFHIIHNLDPLYEGRLYPKKEDGLLSYIHELPDYYLYDSTWDKVVLNPSRCAILACGNG
jgi:hypothetical protein